MSFRTAYVQIRGNAAFHDFEPGTSGVSESQNVPFVTASNRSRRNATGDASPFTRSAFRPSPVNA